MSANSYRIDSHKLHLHPRRVADWMDGKSIAPLYMEVSPSGSCNHRCSFCGMDFMGYQSRFLPADAFCLRLGEMGKAGVKAIMYAGEGEPFLHREMPRIALTTHKAGIDISFTTNGVLLRPEIVPDILDVTSWIKVSCNAGTADTYARVHGTKPRDFDKALHNLAHAVDIRKKSGSGCTLGLQMILLPENRHEAKILAHSASQIGVDYLVIKPYSPHRQSTKDAYRNLRYDDYPSLTELAEDLASLSTPSFSVIFRHEAMKRTCAPATYDRCLALPFWGYIDSGGNVWGCLRHIGEDSFAYGNIVETPFDELLNARKLPSQFDITDCHTDCRMDPINAYLWALKHPGAHDNFI